MKKIILTMAAAALALGAAAQEKGEFEVYEFGNFKLHVYYTCDALDDASFIVEGADGLVTLEQPLFKDNAAEFDSYMEKLAKPVVQRICDYHIGGTGEHEIVMPEGMPEFIKGEVYSGMMQGFSETFGDALSETPTGKASEVPFGSEQNWAGVSFKFTEGPASDFPAASILIGSKIYYSHWAPSEAHANALQISSPAAIDAELQAASEALESGAELFIGGHGKAAGTEAAEFKAGYLKTMKEAYEANDSAEGFTAAMTEAYPGLPGEEGLAGLAAALYAAE